MGRSAPGEHLVNLRQLDRSHGGRGLYSWKDKRRLRELEELYGRYGESLYRHLAFRLGSAEDADEDAEGNEGFLYDGLLSGDLRKAVY